MDKAVLDENNIFSNITFNKVRILDPLTSFIGSKNRGKEGISKTGSRMSTLVENRALVQPWQAH